MQTAFPRARLALCALLLSGVVLSVGASGARAFDMAGYRARLDATVAEAKGGSISDAKPTLARLDEMIALGKDGAREYGEKQPQFAKLMAVAMSDADAMRGMTDGEIEDAWGEDGNAGDAAGVPLKSLGQFDATRANLELIVSPAHTYFIVKKWQAKHKPALLEQVVSELSELSEHLKQAQ